MDREAVYQRLTNIAHDRETFFHALQTYPVDVVADLMLHIPAEYKELRQLLPPMASEETQVNWTGSSGYPLLFQSCGFVRALDAGVQRFANKRIDNTTILDYGCGWGRLLRLMVKFTYHTKLYGCDPWDKSIELCREANVPAIIKQSDYLPKELPFPGVTFDLIYAYSVFTHLSERATNMALAACRKSIADDGVMVVTVRPFSYWEYHNQVRPEKIDQAQLERAHRERGFAFRPHNRTPIDGDVTYGDTSISLDYIQENWKDWKVIGTDVLLQDAYQTMVFLQPC